MMYTGNFNRPPVLLVVSDQEWSIRSLETVLGPEGFAVLRAYTGADGLTRARNHPPDIIVVDLVLPDMRGTDLIQILVESTGISDTIPIVATSAGPAGRRQRLDAMRAGAWEFLGHPFDAEEVVLRLRAYVRARFAAERMVSGALLDRDTGLYSAQGLARRGRELGNHAYRQRAALACVALSVNGTGLTEERMRQIRDVIATALRKTGRHSDAIGILGTTEFGIIAPCTDDAGAQRLAERLRDEIAKMTDSAATQRWELRAGFDTVPNYRDNPVDPGDLLRRATDASRNDGAEWIQRFADPNGG